MSRCAYDRRDSNGPGTEAENTVLERAVHSLVQGQADADVVIDDLLPRALTLTSPNQQVVVAKGASEAATKLEGSGNGWAAVICTPPCSAGTHRCRVRVEHTGQANVMVGVVRPDADISSGCFNAQQSAMVSLRSLLRYTNGVSRGAAPLVVETPLPSGTELELTLNATLGTLSLEVVGSASPSTDYVFTNLPRPLAFAFDLYNPDDTITLLPAPVPPPATP